MAIVATLVAAGFLLAAFGLFRRQGRAVGAAVLSQVCWLLLVAALVWHELHAVSKFDLDLWIFGVPLALPAVAAFAREWSGF